MKINPLNQIETIEIVLTEEKFPIAYAAKLKELMEQGNSEEFARQVISANTFIMEVYYSPNNGLFAVESGALEVPETVCDPYTGMAMEDADVNMETWEKINKLKAKALNEGSFLINNGKSAVATGLGYVTEITSQDVVMSDATYEDFEAFEDDDIDNIYHTVFG